MWSILHIFSSYRSFYFTILYGVMHIISWICYKCNSISRTRFLKKNTKIHFLLSKRLGVFLMHHKSNIFCFPSFWKSKISLFGIFHIWHTLAYLILNLLLAMSEQVCSFLKHNKKIHFFIHKNFVTFPAHV